MNYTKKFEGSFGIELNKYKIFSSQNLSTEIEVQRNEPYPYNIYMVLKRPKISIDADSFIRKDNYYSFKYRIHIKETYVVKDGEIHVDDINEIKKIDSEYPYNILTIHSIYGGGCKIPIDMYVNDYVNTYEPLLDYEVLYIGQAFGKNGKRTAFDRLLCHEHLQRIILDNNNSSPDQDILIMVADFNVNKISILPPSNISTLSHRDEEEYKKFNRLDSYISKNQQINITEAALINIFKPQYNEKFIDDFPNIHHKSYFDCYKLDITNLYFMMEWNENNYLYSDCYPKSNYSSSNCVKKIFNFSDSTDRFKLFDMFNVFNKEQ